MIKAMFNIFKASLHPDVFYTGYFIQGLYYYYY